jgi:hypothetical protein
VKTSSVAVVALTALIAAATAASAQQSTREACCKKVGGRWAAERPGSSTYYCYGFPMTGPTANAFAQCVQGGGAKKK